MFNLRFFSDQFGYSQRDEAVEQAEQCAHFGGVGNAAVGIGDFGDKQGNRQSDACRHADQQQIEVGDGVVDPELKQTGNFDHQVNAESFAGKKGNENDQRQFRNAGKDDAGVAEAEEKKPVIDNRLEIAFKAVKFRLAAFFARFRFMRNKRDDENQRQRGVHVGFVQSRPGKYPGQKIGPIAAHFMFV